MMEDNELLQQQSRDYVYLYRDLAGKVLYVGYGANHKRATSHSSRSHSKTLASFLAENKYTLEIAGPFRSEVTGRAVETALISALRPAFNKHPGSMDCRFRPLGLPNHFADRLLLPPLKKRDFFRNLPRNVSSVLFVYIGDRDFGDGRKPYDPTKPPNDRQMLERMDRWWQIGRHLASWTRSSSQSPALLIGVTGSLTNRFIVGAVKIATERWSSVEKDGGLYSIPIAGPNDLDAFGLRGRKVSPEARLRFGALTPQFFIILKRNGQVVGGGR